MDKASLRLSSLNSRGPGGTDYSKQCPFNDATTNRLGRISERLSGLEIAQRRQEQALAADAGWRLSPLRDFPRLFPTKEIPPEREMFPPNPLDSAGWLIQKDGYGLPSYRYKTGYVYVRDSSDHDPYCRVVSATIKQDYAGGGTYNTETYRSSVAEVLFGCP